MVSAATVLHSSQRTCRIMLFASDSCRGGNYGGNGIGNRSCGAAATEAEAVAWQQWKQRQQQWKHRASGRKIGSGGSGGSRRNRGSGCSSGNSGNGTGRQQRQQQGQATALVGGNKGSGGGRTESTRERQR